MWCYHGDSTAVVDGNEVETNAFLVCLSENWDSRVFSPLHCSLAWKSVSVSAHQPTMFLSTSTDVVPNIPTSLRRKVMIYPEFVFLL